MFGFLSGVRNYSKVTPISDPKGLPQDSEYLNKPSEYGYYIKDMYYGGHIPEQDRGRKYTDILYDANYHSHSYLTLKELLDFDYSKTFEDRRTTKTEIRSNGGTLINGAHVCVEGSGSTVTYRDYLGESFFECIYQLKMLGAPEDVRIIFWFDN
jgi:hypothetical protein